MGSAVPSSDWRGAGGHPCTARGARTFLSHQVLEPISALVASRGAMGLQKWLRTGMSALLWQSTKLGGSVRMRPHCCLLAWG